MQLAMASHAIFKVHKNNVQFALLSVFHSSNYEIFNPPSAMKRSVLGSIAVLQMAFASTRNGKSYMKNWSRNALLSLQ